MGPLDIERYRGMKGLNRYWPIVVPALAVLLTLGSLRVGWWLDDYYQRWVIQGSPGYADVGRKPLDAFCFIDGDSRRNGRMIEQGLLPWWVYTRAKAAFWKPLTVLTHMLDYQLWPNRPALMHAQSVFWFALLVGSVCLLFRHVLRPTLAAAIAGLLYAVDHSRAVPVAWLANRNSVLAALFGVLAIHAHIVARRKGSRAMAFLSPVFLTMCLLSAEAGIGAVAYLVAFALTLDPAGWRRGLLRLWPHLLVVAAWRIAWSAQGYGVYGIEDLYTDPGAHPLRFALIVLQRAPLYMLGQWTGFPSEVHWAVSAPFISAMWWTGVLVSSLLAVIVIPTARRSRVVRFCALGMVLATIPMCSAAPMNRHLMFIGLGAAGLLGQFLATSLHPRFWRGPVIRRAGGGVLVSVLVCIHLVLAPIALAILARFPIGPPEFLVALHALPVEPDPARDLIIVNHPLPMDVLHLLTGRAVDRQSLPRTVRVLAPATTAVHVLRTDERTLLMRPDSGYFPLPPSRLGYNRDDPFTVGRVIALPSMTVTIMEMTGDDRPAAVQFRFAAALDDASLQWVYWESGGFYEFRPPAVGEAVIIPASGLPF
jgi:hypothetical protein